MRRSITQNVHDVSLRLVGPWLPASRLPTQLTAQLLAHFAQVVFVRSSPMQSAAALYRTKTLTLWRAEFPLFKWGITYTWTIAANWLISPVGGVIFPVPSRESSSDIAVSLSVVLCRFISTKKHDVIRISSDFIFHSIKNQPGWLAEIGISEEHCKRHTHTHPIKL